MEILKASLNDLFIISNIVQVTIKEIYPKYYPNGAVNYFLNHHSDKNILQAIENNEVYKFLVNDICIGTGSIKENDISRLFILPTYQRNGYGTIVLNYFEEIIFKNFTEIILAASFPTYNLYLKRGYKPFEYHKIQCDNGDYLCYHLMKLSN